MTPQSSLYQLSDSTERSVSQVITQNLLNISPSQSSVLSDVFSFPQRVHSHRGYHSINGKPSFHSASLVSDCVYSLLSSNNWKYIFLGFVLFILVYIHFPNSFSVFKFQVLASTSSAYIWNLFLDFWSFILASFLLQWIHLLPWLLYSIMIPFCFVGNEWGGIIYALFHIRNSFASNY